MDLQQLEAWRESAIRMAQYHEELARLRVEMLSLGNGMGEHSTSRDSTPKIQRCLEQQERTRDKYNRACREWKGFRDIFLKERYKLTQPQKDIIYMRFALAHPWKTVESRMDMTTGSVKYQYRRALERLVQKY